VLTLEEFWQAREQEKLSNPPKKKYLTSYTIAKNLGLKDQLVYHRCAKLSEKGIIEQFEEGDVIRIIRTRDYRLSDKGHAWWTSLRKNEFHKIIQRVKSKLHKEDLGSL